jgi:hypothetical protein
MNFMAKQCLELRINIMSRQFIIVTSLLIFYFQFSGISSAQSYRDLGPVSLNETFRNLLKFSKYNEFENLEKSLQLIKPLSQTLDSKYSNKSGKAIQNSIEKKDGEKAVQGIQQLIFLDIKDQLLIGIDTVPNSKEQALSQFKNAYMDYLLLSPSIQENNYSGDQKIKNLFRKLLLLINKSDQLPAVYQDIEKEIMNSFPNLK